MTFQKFIDDSFCISQHILLLQHNSVVSVDFCCSFIFYRFYIRIFRYLSRRKKIDDFEKS